MAANPESIETIAMPLGVAAAAERQRFTPGTLLGSRYRIVSRLGKGGMGEVFRADDLVLNQQVALKFLPESAKGNVNLLTRFYDEVRIARQIAHKNVCRVYDIGEIEGQPYLSMEYIDGEDLGGLLRRIGRLPGDKASEFARKLCAGLAAAHAQGVLHRDLKPANIMVDSRGEIRITDFGLAAIAQQLQGAEIRNGTPAYMAPEQLSGREVSIQSDIYALGLVLYEMFTGKPAFQADTLAEIVRQREEGHVTNPSTLTPDIDNTAERAILRCLDPDPKNRPASALALAASMPGGDPLAEALAAGETPTPGMVAAAGSTEGLNPKIAIGVLAAALVLLIVFCISRPTVLWANRLPLENSPEVLAAKARDLARSLGFAERATDTVYGVDFDAAYLGEVFNHRAPGRTDWNRTFSLAPGPIFFWYRQSPSPMVARSFNSGGQVGLNDPPENFDGMVTIGLELDGRLRFLRAVPPQMEEGAKPEGAGQDWLPQLFAAARLDANQLQPAEPQWTPLTATDARYAWTGVYPGRPEIPLRVETAFFHGRPVFFETILPWTKPPRKPAPPGLTTRQVGALAEEWMQVLVGLAACAIARYNWKAGRGDMRGAIRVGLAVSILGFLGWLFKAHHLSTDAERELLGEAIASALFSGFLYWIVYLALEPWVRRFWPQSMISWSRLLDGRFRDPMIGRDLLFAVPFGLAWALLLWVVGFVIVHTGGPLIGGGFNPSGFLGGRAIAGELLSQVADEIVSALRLFLVLLLARKLLRKPWLAAAATIAIFAVIENASGGDSYAIFPLYAAIFTVLTVVLLRFGFLAALLTSFIGDAALHLYSTTDFSAWWGESSLVAVVLLIGLALWGFKVALEGRKIAPTGGA
ncbi:MAG TPA: serine/threonine-protein kinase [Bryobacteraceae bacterium]|nr:serine/threonine-protein kinase [Bryobacteraceae bacterium]